MAKYSLFKVSEMLDSLDMIQAYWEAVVKDGDERLKAKAFVHIMQACMRYQFQGKNWTVKSVCDLLKITTHDFAILQRQIHSEQLKEWVREGESSLETGASVSLNTFKEIMNQKYAWVSKS